MCSHIGRFASELSGDFLGAFQLRITTCPEIFEGDATLRVWCNTDAFEILAGPGEVGSDGQRDAIAVAHLERACADESAWRLDADQMCHALFRSEGSNHLCGAGGVFIYEQ